MTMTKRVEKLRDQSLKAVPYISIERAQLVDEVYRKYQGEVPTPILRALAFKNNMEKKKLCINEGELIVGERGEAPAATPTYPELCCHTVEDFEVMNDRDRIFFKVNAETLSVQKKQIIPFWKNRSIRHKIINSVDQEWRDCYYAGVFTEFMEQRSPGHTVADEKIYHKGFKDFKKDIAQAIADLDWDTDNRALDRKAQLEAMDICCDAIITLGKRYSIYAKELAEDCADPKRKAELERISEICAHVPEHAPRNYYEALQMYWFVHVGVISELNNWDSFCPGRLDQHLNPFYQKEIEQGTLTKAEAEELLQCFWVKFNNQPAPPKVGVTLKESGTYTDFSNINSGGLTVDGHDAVNEVTYLILDVIDEMKLLQPSSNVQVSRKSPHEFVKRASEIAAKGWGQPSFFNADAVIEEMLRMGKTLEDARCGGTSGCVETGAFGKEAYILTGYFNLPKILEIMLYNGRCSQTGQMLGLETGDPRFFTCYDEFFAAFEKQMKYFSDIKIKGNNIIERIYAKYMPAPFLSIIIDDCISKGMDYNEGGARYNTSYVQGVGIGTMADCLAVVKKHVFEEKRITMDDLISSLESNFEGHEFILNLVKNHTPKYGNDDDYVDELMTDTFNSYFKVIDNRPNMKGGQYRINMLPTTCHVYFGSVIGALPNGRQANRPLPEGISPSKGADLKGPTAVCKSASKMDHLKTGGTLLNQKFTPDVLKNEQGIENLVHLVRGYFELDGHHIQFNVIDKATLVEAQKNPEAFENLIVRVAGYSDYFNNLDKALQDEIIQRTEQNFSGC